MESSYDVVTAMTNREVMDIGRPAVVFREDVG